MDTKALRQKVLDLAIRGKLVPQYPNDEPASVLLERIRQQKQQMVEEGKLKAKDIKNDTIIFVGEDNLHYEKFADGCVKCIEDEIPFDLPDGWAWCRLQSIATIQSSKRVFEKDYVDDGIPFYRSKEIGDLSRNEEIRSQLFITESHYLELKDKYGAPQIGDILITSVGSIGNTWICDGRQFYYKDGNITQIVANSFFVSEYVQLFLKTDYFFEQVGKTVSGSAYNALTIEKLKNILFALPPYNEQQRIVNALKPYNELVETVEVSKTDLLQLLSKTKAKILDLAIRGQLVPQDPSDEPVSVLLERIRAGKEELIKQGKIKRDKKQSVIFRGDDNSYYEKIGSVVICIDEEVPFEIPETWEWMRLESCCIKEIRRGKSPKYIDESGTLVFAQKCNTKYSGIDVGLALFLDESTLGRYPDDEYMHDGDVVINSTGTGTLGRVGIYHATDNHLGLPIVPDSHITVIRATHSIQAFFMYAFMKANQSELEKKGEGSTNQKELKPLTLKEMLIPIPPYAEQERIVDALTAAFSTISAIEKSLN